MAASQKAISKRSARTYIEDGAEAQTEKDVPEHAARRMSANESMAPDEASGKISILTATSQRGQNNQMSRRGSVEASPCVSAINGYVPLDTIPLMTLEQDNYEGVVGTFGSIQGFHAFRSPELPNDLPAAGRPINFGIVVPGVYRSSFPQAGDHEFIESLKLKTMVTLVQKDFPDGYQTFIQKNGIKHQIFNMKGTKKEEIPIDTMKAILRVVLDRKNHPLLIHCNHGKHRTGCVVAIVRMVSGWDMGNIICEYKNYAGAKARDCDIKYITGFQLVQLSNLFRAPDWRSRKWNFFRIVVVMSLAIFIWLLSGFTTTADAKVGRHSYPFRAAAENGSNPPAAGSH
ncbi:hypothetical protein QBC47DRAFT_25063 [Echria macrotheca]|uniref:diphosphoinositol-polyphosphate diphosphatase n=1 Tax=Echria macrotheca TaxID=438768 RepID=A0AAJ0BQ05_9PEZI|nr:hypothetical protein QBC47DRAFT_25063 [Echria macrotheca]